MFERFTDRARRVLVLAQEEARLLHDGFIGTEHLLLGLLREGEGVAATGLRLLGISLEPTRRRLEELREPGPQERESPPFTPRAKKVMELALREALELGHTWIGTEHLLLGIGREGEGTAMAVLHGFDVTGAQLRQQVIALLRDIGEEHPDRSTAEVAPSGSGRAAWRHGAGPAVGTVLRRSPSACSFCGRDLWEVDRYVATERAAICAACVALAAGAVERGEADRSGEVPFPPRVFGEAPDDDAVDRVVAAFRATFGPRPAGVGDHADDPLAPFLARLGGSRFGLLRPPRVRRVRFGDDGAAECDVLVRFDPEPVLEVVGRAVRVDGRWEVSWATITEVLTRLGIDGPGPPPG